MFIQVIQGRVADPAALRAAIDRWGQDLQSGAEGWLGTTDGITDDGRFVATVRFDAHHDTLSRDSGERTNHHHPPAPEGSPAPGR